MTQVTLEQASQRLSDLVAAAVGGEDVILVQNDRPAVRLVPIESSEPPRRRRFGSAKGLIYMSEDFDAPLEDFREHME